MLLLVKKWYDKAGINPSIVYSILTRLVQSAAGILALLLITRFLNKNEQGYYYTFTSLLAIQVFFELGLTGIITQYVAHEAAHLSWLSKNQLTGPAYYQSRLTSIVQLSIKWFAGLAILLFGVLYAAGHLFFSRFNANLPVSWETAWLILSLATAILLLVNLFLAILEGLGKIAEVNKLRFIQQVLNLLLLTLFFGVNLKLLSGGLALLISNLILSLVVFGSYRQLFFNLWRVPTPARIHFRTEILPYLYKIGLGSISGYLIFQLINPVLFATQGPVLAGQMGATQTFLNGILVISLSWLSTKVAVFSNLVSRKKFAELNLVYRKNFLVSLLVCLVGLLVFVGMVYGLKVYYPTLGNRFLPITPLIFLGMAQVASVIGNAQAYYLRSFKEEPFFIPSLVIGVLSGLFTIICSKYAGITTLSVVYFLINGVIGFTWATLIFRQKTWQWTHTRLPI